MKSILYLFLFSAVLVSCQKEKTKTYVPRALTTHENFNVSQSAGDTLAILPENAADPKSLFEVKYKDTTVDIQTSLTDKNVIAKKFAFAEFVNTEKSTVLVQAADSSGLVAPFYLISLKDGKPDVVSIYRASNGAQDRRFTKGLKKVGRSGYEINNDFFIATVATKVYPIKRQKPDERIQGLYFINSPDKHTLVFLVSNSLYEVNYLTDESYTEVLSPKMPKAPGEIEKWIQSHYSWQANKSGSYFLKANADDNRIIDISQFK
ncbi:hypothetical protein [Pedobacter sp. L105]|uniref:hypothetical protein n=1 Tax=Pedobacter sp. L105 TaxID=1641871 RepID=UPI00131E3FE6|nr:hypothetical protein [Pedobacter sp. L105]